MPPRHAKKTFKRKTTGRTFKRKSVSKVAPKRRIGLRRKTAVTHAPHSLIGKYPRQFVKLKWTENLNAQSIAAGSNQALTWYPGQPAPADSANPPVAGDTIWDGMQLYAAYYGLARLHAAKIKINVFNAGNTQAVKTVLYAVASTLDGRTIATNTPSTLGSLTYEQLISMNGVRYRTLGLAQGSKNQSNLMMYRKTASMFNKTSIRDDSNTSTQVSTSLAHGNWHAPVDTWFFQLNTFNIDSTNAQVVDYTVRISGWWEFYQPIFNYQQTLT